MNNSINLDNYPNNKCYNFKKKYLIKRKNSFRQNIFNFDSMKEKNNNFNTFNDSISRISGKNKEIKIIDKAIKKNIKSINIFGPHFSFCPSCQNKNLEFYNEMEPKQCLCLINYIKNVKSKKNIKWAYDYLLD